MSFDTTRWSIVAAARDGDSPAAAAALEKLCRAYWYPLYSYVRRKGLPAADAQDATQEFFCRLIGKNYLESVDRSRGSFRSFLLASINHLLANERDKARALKRGEPPHTPGESLLVGRHPAPVHAPEDSAKIEGRNRVTALPSRQLGHRATGCRMRADLAEAGRVAGGYSLR